ncbi:MAG: DNA polymerase III subunit alpha [Bacteroidales bacterium]
MFAHLHVHTEYSTLDGASKISHLVKKAVEDGMPAIAITDHGNMFGVKDFFDCISKTNGKDTPKIKPIIGCEVYVAENSRFDKNGKTDASGYHLILLAKNKIGYHNLTKLVSLGHLDGMYYKPRIDKEILTKYKEGLIVSSACLAGEIPYNINRGNLQKAEEVILWYKNLFADDFYIEIQRHKATDPDAAQDTYPTQQAVNEQIIPLARKHNIKVIATNDVHFVNEDEALAHDRLLCVSTNSDVNNPTRMRYSRQEWFKTTAEMQAIFADIPEAISNTLEIAEKVEFYDINSKPLMPDFTLPKGFENEGDYLRHLTYNGSEDGMIPGVKIRYPELTDEIKERIDFELDTMINMGFPGYFLIVQDFIAAARRMGVSVGPGRGSAAGSVVAYCLRITDIDPLKYGLLFERFLNPDRISMPDIDIDFDDNGRGKVLQYVTEKYGKEKVAQIVTFTTMAAKSALKDIARVEQLPLSESTRLTKLIDQLEKDDIDKATKTNTVIKKAIEKIPEMRAAAESPDKILHETMEFAQKLEGTVRNVGVHACGVIIGSDDLKNIVPISIAKDKETGENIAVVQYEGSKIEDVGLIKMDFLGLKTLSILNEAVNNIEHTHNIKLDLTKIPIDDKSTYDMFSRGDTVGIFQFESDGMRKHLRDLRPSVFEDLIAMNALYRPGPMQYIPDYIDRKHGRKKVEYDIPEMENILKETYGITAYQEQVMLLSRTLANFTRGESDELRKAMGKKIREKLLALKPKFIAGCKANNHDEKKVEKIWSDWEEFANYAFNKSHSACYAWIAYQTGYIKANYLPEYMAALLSCNISSMVEISKFMDECRRLNIEVLTPDVNESNITFSVNKEGNIRFGLGAIKGVGEAAANDIVKERRENGAFKDVFDFFERVNLQSVNKRMLESLFGSGAFDAFKIPREAYMLPNREGVPFIEVLTRYGLRMQTEKNSSQQSLFGDATDAEMIQRPNVPELPSEPNSLERLKLEKELVGVYLSGHPLDQYKSIQASMVNHSLSDLNNLPPLENKNITLMGMVVGGVERITKSGDLFSELTLEDYTGTYKFVFFKKDHLKFGAFAQVGLSILVKGIVREPRYKKQDNSNSPKLLRFEVSSIELLSEVRDNIKNITITLPINEKDSNFCKELITHIHNCERGDTKVTINVINTASKVSCELKTRSLSIALNSQLEHFLREHNVTFKIG